MKIQTLFNNIYGVSVNTGLTQELATVQFVDNNLLDVRTILAAASDDIGNLEEGLNTTNTNLTNLTGEVAINTSGISTLNTNLAATNLALDTLTDDVRSVESNVSSLQAALPGKLDATATAVTASKLATVRTISTSGDATVSISFDGSANASGVLTLTNTGVVAGTYNDSAIAVRPFTVDAKGRITQIGAAVNITPSFASLTGKPTTLAGYGITDALPATATAVAATKLATARTITLNGDVTGSVAFDGTANVSISAVVGDDSHNHSISTVTGLQTALDSKLNAAGGAMTGDLLPANAGLNIGSSTQRWNAIYVDEAYLSTNTLYIGDTPIMGTEADTIIIKADPDQSIAIKTTGLGDIAINSEDGIIVSTNGTNADVRVQAVGVNSKVRLSGTGGVEISDPTTVQNNLTVSGNLAINGSFTVNGPQFLVNATTVTTKDNIIVVNSGEVGSGVTAGRAGIQIDRGDASDYQLVFDETTDKFVVGQVGGTFETLATREFVESSVGTSTQIALDAKVDKVAGKALSTNDFTDMLKVKLDGIEAGATGDMTKAEIEALGINAATVNGFTVGKSVPSNAVFTDTIYVKPANEPISYISGLQTALDSKSDTGHVHSNATTSVAGFMSTADKSKLDGIATNANNYAHPTGDGNLHVPATGTTNAGKVLTAGSTAGSLSWTTIPAAPVSSVAGKTGTVTLTKADVGLGNVDNTADSVKVVASADKLTTARTVTLSGTVSGSTTFDGSANVSISTSVPNATTSVSGLMSGADKTKLDGIATNANNYAHPTGDGNLHVPATGTTNAGKVLTAGATAGSLSWTTIPAAPVTSVAGRTGVVTLTKADVGLGNVDNTSDASKPISTATQEALDGKANVTHTHTVSEITDFVSAVDAKIQAVVGAAPAALDTLGEIATQLANDQDAVSALTTVVAGKADAIHTHGVGDVTGLQTALDGKLGSTATAAAATKLATARTISLTGDATGSVNFDGSANASIIVAVGDDSHNHSISTVTGLQTALDGKLGATATAVAATKLATARTISTTGDASFSVTFDGTANASGTLTLGNTGVTAGTYGSASLIPVLGVDAKGRVTTASTVSVNIPSGAISVTGGDITLSGTTGTAITNATLVNSGVTAGTYNNSATAVRPIVVDAKGRVTGVGSEVTITPSFSVITGKPTTLEGYGISVPNATTSVAGFMSTADKMKLDGIATNANNYAHPTGDGNLHVPATGTTNAGKVLTAGATAGSLSWTTIPAAPVSSVAGRTGAIVLAKADVGLGNVDDTADSVKVVASAAKLTTARTISTSGDATFSVSFDGNSNVSGAITLVNTGVVAGTYRQVTVDAKGRVTAGVNPTTLVGYGITDAISVNDTFDGGTF